VSEKGSKAKKKRRTKKNGKRGDPQHHPPLLEGGGKEKTEKTDMGAKKLTKHRGGVLRNRMLRKTHWGGAGHRRPLFGGKQATG